jgi:hypothetical protein
MPGRFARPLTQQKARARAIDDIFDGRLTKVADHQDGDACPIP